MLKNNPMSQPHQIFPQSFKDSYSQNDVVDFVMTFENQSMLANSIRITGDLYINSTGATAITSNSVDNSKNVVFDSITGIHGAWQAITSVSDSGVLENNNDYPRYVKAKAMSSLANTQFGTESSRVCELRSGDTNSTIARALATGNPNSRGISFSMVPDIALNKSSDHIPFNKTGPCKITLRLATNNQFLYGSDNDSNYNYEIKNLQLHYRTIPQSSSKQLQFETVMSISNTIDSNNASLATRVPATVQSVSCVFIREKNLNQLKPNHLALEVPPAVERVEFSFNDSTTQYLTYELTNREEILYNYQRSWGQGKKHNMTLELLDHEGRSYGIGMPFGQLIDMSNSKFGLNLKSNISNQDKYAIIMFFRGVVGL